MQGHPPERVQGHAPESDPAGASRSDFSLHSTAYARHRQAEIFQSLITLACYDGDHSQPPRYSYKQHAPDYVRLVADEVTCSYLAQYSIIISTLMPSSHLQVEPLAILAGQGSVGIVS